VALGLTQEAIAINIYNPEEKILYPDDLPQKQSS
jgi:hypothetical protein